MSTSEKPQGTAAAAEDVKQQEGSYWLPQCVTLKLTYLEAGWLFAALHDAPETACYTPNSLGAPVPSTIPAVIGKRLHEAVLEAMDTPLL